MSDYTFVTTFSPEGYELYGQHCIASFLEFGKPMEMLVYHESQPEVEFDDRLTWHNLDHDLDRERFIEDYGNDPDKVGTPKDPNSQAIRFCHKVFALTDAVERVQTPWMIWCDADVLFHAEIEPELKYVCPEGTDLAYLGRQDMPYTECGFVAYRTASNLVKSLLDDMRHYYTSGEIFSRPRTDWHDSKCFDIARERSGVPAHRWHNMSENLPGAHGWPKTLLNRFSIHQKGPRRKMQAYGAIVP